MAVEVGVVTAVDEVVCEWSGEVGFGRGGQGIDAMLLDPGVEELAAGVSVPVEVDGGLALDVVEKGAEGSSGEKGVGAAEVAV